MEFLVNSFHNGAPPDPRAYLNVSSGLELLPSREKFGERLSWRVPQDKRVGFLGFFFPVN